MLHVSDTEFSRMSEGQQNIVIDAQQSAIFADLDFDHAEVLFAKLPRPRPGFDDCFGIDVKVRHSGKEIRIERYSNHKTLGLPCYRVKEGNRTTRKGIMLSDADVLNWFAGLD